MSELARLESAVLCHGSNGWIEADIAWAVKTIRDGREVEKHLRQCLMNQYNTILELQEMIQNLDFRIEAQAATISQLLADIKSNGA